VRSITRGEAAKNKIEAETGIKNVVVLWQLDLGSYESVKAFAKKVEGLERVDAVIENAGVALNKMIVAEGWESSLTVNVVSTMLLAILVLPKLRESARKFGIVPQVVVVGSEVAFTVEGELEKVDGDILEGLNKYEQLDRRYVLGIPLHCCEEAADDKLKVSDFETVVILCDTTTCLTPTDF
jgi:NAD(P)-dependent dehydrogenase (short-subunit alcohol dehydrogenase family)